MRLNYRDKIILLVFIVLLIIIVFVAVPIKVTKDKIKLNEVAYEKVNEIKEDYEKKIEQIPVLEKKNNKCI